MKITVHGQPVRELYRAAFEKLILDHKEKYGYPPTLVVEPRNQGIPVMVAHSSEEWVDYRQTTWVMGSSY